jgi:hypothetical protein
LQYDGLSKELHIYLSIEGVNVIPERNEIPFEFIKTLTNFEDMIKHINPFNIDYLIWIYIPRTDIDYRKQELLKIFKKFCEGYSELYKNSPEFIELISSIEKMIPNSNKI